MTLIPDVLQVNCFNISKRKYLKLFKLAQNVGKNIHFIQIA